MKTIMHSAIFVLVLFPFASLSQGLGQIEDTAAFSTAGSPLQVSVGIEIEQITSVDQKSENYGAVATIRMKWHDPLLVFEPLEYPFGQRIMSPHELIELAAVKKTILPVFELQNQQERRWVQDSIVVIASDGMVELNEKSGMTLQAPNFDFTRFPFDRQTFFLNVVSVYPNEWVAFVPMEEFSGLSDTLGEEAWILENSRITAGTDIGLRGLESSQVSLVFEGRRHLQYYWLRIFLPLGIIISVSWAIFFLEEYRRRIDLAAGNLLVFVAFNFAVSDSLPRLGYITFLDFILQWMFVLTGSSIVANIGLRRLKTQGREELARKIDRYAVIWIVPLAHIGVMVSGYVRYLALS